MVIEEILKDKSLKSKAKVEAIASAIINEEIKIDELIKIAIASKTAEKGTCIESMEFATKTNPEISNQKMFDFVVKSLEDDAPRVKWESAKVIANTAELYKTKLDGAINLLLINTEHTGTVVRWSAAQALSKILLCKTKRNTELITVIEAILKREENNAIQKIYAKSLKQLAKEK